MKKDGFAAVGFFNSFNFYLKLKNIIFIVGKVMLKQVALLGMVAVLGLVCQNSALAGRTWHYYDIDLDGSGYYNTNAEFLALGMRSDKTWPVVIGTEYNHGYVSTLTPGGWASSEVSLSGSIRSATSSDGKVAVVGEEGNIAVLTRDGVLSNSVGNCNGFGSNDVAFNKNNDLVVAHTSSDGKLTVSYQTGNGWASSTIMNDQYSQIGSDRFTMGVDSYNQTHVAYINGPDMLGYAVKSPVSDGRWSISETNIQGLSANYMDMAINTNDIPFVIYNNNYNELNCAVFNPMTASWDVSIVDSFIESDFFTVAADSKGGVGISYVSNNELSYAYFDGDCWNIDRLCTADFGIMPGLDFDYEDNPVIAFSQNGDLKIAYDPIVAPEPATLLFLGFGGVVLRRKKA